MSTVHPNPSSDLEQIERQAKIAHNVASALYGAGSVRYDLEMARVLGKEILNEELQRDPKPLATSEPYELSNDVRDSLIAHTRQDVAVNFGMLDALLKRVDRLEWQLKGIRNLAWFQLVALIALLVLIYR